MSQRKELMILRALHGLHGEIAAGLDEPRDDALCYNCDGQGRVFPGLPGHPMIPDTSQILECPVCDGSGKSKPQLRLF